MKTDKNTSKQSEHGGPDQRSRFIEAARELGADEDEATFKAKLGLIARQRVKDEPETIAIVEALKHRRSE